MDHDRADQIDPILGIHRIIGDVVNDSAQREGLNEYRHRLRTEVRPEPAAFIYQFKRCGHLRRHLLLSLRNDLSHGLTRGCDSYISNPLHQRGHLNGVKTHLADQLSSRLN